MSRTYVNNVNITNTTVNITRVTNVYNTVVINRRVNSVTYVNRNVNGGVTVVSHETFVNARPVARNVVAVPARELASAPVSHRVEVEPARTSVLGAGRPVAKKPPAAVVSRPVVALRTPAPMPRSFDQKQAQAGGRLNQPASTRQSLVRQEPPGRPVPTNQGTRQEPPTQDGFRPFGQAGGNNNQAKPQPENRNTQPSGTFRPPQTERQPTQEWSHPLAKPAPPVQERNEQQKEQKFNNWQQQRPAPPPKSPQHSSPPPRQEKPPKK